MRTVHLDYYVTFLIFFCMSVQECSQLMFTDKNNRPQNFRYALKTFFSRNARLEVEVNILK